MRSTFNCMRAAAGPVLLGSLADQHGITAAFALEPALVGICVLLLWRGSRSHQRSHP